jgi:hypothetical protein
MMQGVVAEYLFFREADSFNKRMHADKIKLRRYALQLYFSGNAGR